MKRRVVKVVSWIMLLVFLVGVAPKEYLHKLLYTHVDTVDPVYKKGEFVISKSHIHCSFLGFVFAPFVVSDKQYINYKDFGYHTTHYLLPAYYYRYSSTHKVVSLRGPPVLACV